MSHQVVALEEGGLLTTTARLEHSLPGFSLALQPLSPRRFLLPASTMRALCLAHGKQGAYRILSEAGAIGGEAVSDAQAIALLRSRDPQLLPGPPPDPGLVKGLDWHLAAIRAPAAWALLGGLDAIAWGSVRVGHVDTGYTRHPVFGFDAGSWIDQGLARTFFAATNSLDDPGPGGGLDPLQGAMDGHGTRTASTICGHAPDAPDGPFYGAAPRVPLVPVRIVSSVWINHAQPELAQAIDHLVDTAQVGMISLSIGIFGAVVLKRLRRAINRAYERGVIVVCAAGNMVQKVVAPAPAAHAGDSRGRACADALGRQQLRAGGRSERSRGGHTARRDAPLRPPLRPGRRWHVVCDRAGCWHRGLVAGPSWVGTEPLSTAVAARRGIQGRCHGQRPGSARVATRRLWQWCSGYARSIDDAAAPTKTQPEDPA